MSEPQEDRFTFMSFPKFVITWPVIVAGILLPILHGILPSLFTTEVVSGIWIVTTLFVIIALGFDFNGFASMAIGLTIFTCFLLGMVINEVLHIPILHQLMEAIQHLAVNVSTATMHTFTFAFGLLYLIMIIICLLNNRWVVTTGTMERRMFPFRGTDEIGIDQNQKVSREIPDMMEWILTFGGGNLKVKVGKTNEDPDYRRIGIVFFVGYADEQIERFEITQTSK